MWSLSANATRVRCRRPPGMSSDQIAVWDDADGIVRSPPADIGANLRSELTTARGACLLVFVIDILLHSAVNVRTAASTAAQFAACGGGKRESFGMWRRFLFACFVSVSGRYTALIIALYRAACTLSVCPHEQECLSNILDRRQRSRNSGGSVSRI